MNKELIYKIARLIPKPIRKLGKLFYNPIIPETLKIDYGEILMPKENLDFMLSKLKEILNQSIEGNLIEFGVYKGGSLMQFAKILKEYDNFKVIFGLDTFEGLPQESNQDKIPEYYKGAMSKNDIWELKKVIIKEDLDSKIYLVKGLFKDRIPNLPQDLKFCFAYVDCDLYEGTKEALEYLIPRMNKGGIIFIDDYTSKNWIGVKKAVLEILPEKEIKEYKGQAYWIKK